MKDGLDREILFEYEIPTKCCDSSGIQIKTEDIRQNPESYQK